MVRRPDLVLATIPLLAVSGVVLERLPAFVAGTSVVDRAASRFPLPVFGFVAATVVILYALFTTPAARGN